MLWTLLKIVLFVCLIGALALGARWLMGVDGNLRMAFAGYEVTLGPLQVVIAALLLLLAIWLLIKIIGLLVALIRFLNGDETAFSRYFARSRERKGYQALGDAMLALASGEGREALNKADRAERYLGRPELTTLLTAQAAEMVGDRKRAEETYKQLVANDRTRFVGVRGLLKQKLDEGDMDTSLALAEKAFELKPKHDETQDVLLRLQAARHDWSGARRTLGAKLKHGTLPRDVHKRRDAVLALSEAREVANDDSTIEQRERAIEANRLSPDLVPAAVMAARGYIENGQERYATRVVKKAWEAVPHPDLAAVFAEIRPQETPAQRIKRFQTLTRLHPDHGETKMLNAELQIAAEDFPAARRALGNVVTENPTARSIALMAAIERGEGADDAVVRGWLTRAVSAPRGPQWTCDNCHTVESSWTPVCGNCGAFDAVSWKEPQSGIVAIPQHDALLPLVVGSTESSPVTFVQETDQQGSGSRRGSTTDGSGGQAEKTGAKPAEAPSRERSEEPTSGRRDRIHIPEAEVLVENGKTAAKAM